MNKFLLAPSIIAADFTRIAEEIAACESAGADWLHVDVMDGHFVPTITIGPLFTEACKRVTKLPLDVHLMISEPEKYLEAFAKAGANNITVHVETCPDLVGTVKKIKSLGCKAGITLNPATPASALDSALPLVDLVLVMSVVPGYSGQAFMPEMVGKVEEIRARLDALHSTAHLEVDGGMSAKTLPLMYKAGADMFVAGSAAFGHPQGVGQGIKILRECV
ncbi:MAG TPA: ribulose-phosphate 3-epimerase [Anaerolineales bacterium]|nr:ribulose-phosphate 3-epimerase [Anaerolineales bacterium]HMV96054.1 ribulose-phosphate 3-epimerase [Anaerolineales bacterium]HMX18609.1 ribulose-phosphate 3-epimerase [Anaerolineales bacterium]HMX74117.1 ribulose-phosphate 3-epimerase [Anaerolineales bacterium]HNA55560.1 ribulose-phosphate 3-epimerase [Anaerolineales bacterium]